MEPVKIFNEIQRTLKSNGKALIVDVRKDASKKELDQIVIKIDSYIMRWGFRHSIKESYTEDDILELVAQTTFKRCEIDESPLELEIWIKNKFLTADLACVL